MSEIPYSYKFCLKLIFFQILKFFENGLFSLFIVNVYKLLSINYDSIALLVT